MAAMHNAVVRPKDKVYFLGDVTMHKSARSLDILAKLNGEKILIKGNHDTCKIAAYMQHFKDIRAVHSVDKIVLTHVPVHPESLSRWRGNVHGHLHSREVLLPLAKIPDKRYFNVSVERINYTPISLDEVNKLTSWK
jgi:calcineurin-like phosphoesterase family protein